MKHFAGLDWGNLEHAACVIDEQGLAAAIIHTPCASWPAHGCVCCGAACATARPTIRRFIAPLNPLTRRHEPTLD
ncbi:MAG: hypothetical protein KC609_07840 [Myxococcales bacterium]|nr:hypothetical protein [Myxococcales bacterium]